MGVFGLRAMAGIARFGQDWSGKNDVGMQDAWRFAANTWGGWADYAGARWTGPAIDTGNPVSDFIRTSIFQGGPMLGAFVALAAIPGVGSAGSAYMMGLGMGGDTYKTLRDEGISPELSAFAAAGTGLVSYYSNRFTLDNITRYLGGRSPMRLFSAGTALEVLEEGGQEVVENVSQAGFESVARLLGDENATAAQEWRRLQGAGHGAITEGGMASVATAAARIIGLPVAMRNQMRANTFANTFARSGEIVAQTEQYARAPEVLASELTGMAIHNGGGPVLTSFAELKQAGVTRAQATAPVAEGGLGIDAARYDAAETTGEDIAVGYGEAAVFAQKQKEAGNVRAAGAFAADPDSMTVGQVKAMEAEADAIATESEAYFATLRAGDDSKAPLRIKIFRAGLRASGRYDPEQADALTAMFWRGAERNAERWGMPAEEWLERRDVQLEMQSLMGKARDVKRYHGLIEESRARHDAALTGAADMVDVPDRTAPVGAAQPDVEIAQNDVRDMIEPAMTDEQNRQWEAAATDTVAQAVAAMVPGLPAEHQARIVEQAKESIAAGSEIPEVRVIADQLGLSPAPRKAAQERRKGAGRRTKIIFPAESGIPAMPGRYQLVELSGLQPSHAFRNYTPNPAWSPAELAQQRNYDSGAMEAVRQGIELDRLDYDAIFNPGTDAINGPPIVTPDGKVLGGNNRTHRIYNRYGADGYRDNLITYLDSGENLTGIQAADALDMERPVLVRVLDDVAVEDIPGLIGALNADFTNRRDPANLAANRGMRVGAKTLAAFAGINDQTVAAYLDSPATARRVLQAMVEDGALQSTDLPALYDFQHDKWLGEGRNSGKAQVEQALFGAILPDSRLLDDLSDGMKRKLVRALPGLIRLKRNNSPELADLFEAVALHNDFQAFKDSPEAKGLKPAARLELFRKPNQADLFTGETPAEKSGPAWDMFLEINNMKTQREVADFFTRKADELSGTGRGLFGGMRLYQDAISAGEQLDAAMRQREQVREMLAQAIGNPANNRGFLNLRQVTASEAEAIQKETGVDVDGYQHMVDISGLQHTWNRHGGSNEKNPANIPLTPDDIANIPVYLLNPTRISTDGKSDLGQDTVVYETDASDSTVVVLEVIRVGRKKLAVYAMRKKKKKGTGGLQRTSETSPALKTGAFDTAGNSIDSIPNAEPNVKPGDMLDELYQDAFAGTQARGSIQFPQAADAPTIIKLLRNADVSTVVHELNHLFVYDLQRMVAAGRGGERARADLAALVEFAGGKLDRAGYEKIAHAWERYAMEGVAPANNLVDAFDVFRTYIARIYRDAVEREFAEPSPEVRRVFDAFLATDEQVAAARRRRDMAEDWSRAEGVSGKARRKMADINARRDARRRVRMDARRGGGRKMRLASEFDARRRIIRGETEAEPVYRAMDWARAKGGMNRGTAVAAIGEAAVKALEEKHGKSVFAEDGIDLTEVARNAGYETDIAGMLAEMAEAKSIDDHVEAAAERRIEMEELEEELAANAQDAAEGVDDETAEIADPYSAGDMTQVEEQDADAIDMIEEVGVAIEEEATEGGAKSALRDVAAKLREWQDAQAVLKRKARADVFSKTMREGGVDIRSYRTARSRARRNAFSAAERGDRGAVVRWKKQELYHHHQIAAAKQARALRERILSKYSPHALKTAIDAKEHQAKIEQQFAQGMAQVAMYAGMAESRYLRQMAGEAADSPMLALPQESGDLGGLVESISDTLPDWLLNKERPGNFKDFRDFTIEQLFEIDRLMRWLMDNGQGKLGSMLASEAATLGELVVKSTAPMERRKVLESTGGRDARTHWNRTLNAVKRFAISITIPENWFMAMDGNPTIQGREMGPNQRLFRRMVDADVKKQMLYSSRIEAMQPHFDALNKERAAWEKRVGGRFATIEGMPVPEILKRGRDISTWDFDLLLSVALNMGNDANLRRLLTDREFAVRFGKKFDAEQDMSISRYNLTNAQLAIVARQFSADGWLAIQGLLDGMNDMYADSDRVTFNLTNRHVAKEAPTAHTVETADGQVLHLRGGYFPLVNDPMLSSRSRELNEKTSIEDQIRTGLLNNVHGAAKRSPGAIKERARGEDGTPLVTLPQILSTNIIPQHIETMAHYIAYAEFLRDMDRLTRHDAWKETYIDRFGQEQYDAVRTWLKNLAAPERGANSPGERFMVGMRNLATINALGLRFKTGLKQRLGAFQAAAFMTDNSGTKSSGWTWLAAGVAEMGMKGNIGIRNTKVDFVNGKSEFMRARSGGFDREIRAMRSRLSPLHREVMGHSLAEVQNATFFWIEANDVAMANAVWLGAYRQALAGEANFDIGKLRADLLGKGRTEEEVNLEIDRRAVEYADTAAATQASSFAADLTEVQRDRGFMRFMSMFMSGNVRQGSRLMQYIDAHRMGDKTGGDVAWLAVREFVFPSLAWVFMRAAVLYAAAEAFGVGDDDDEGLLAEAFWESLDTAAAPFPLVRELPRVFQYGSLAGDVTAVKSTARAATNVIGSVSKMTEGEYGLAVGKAMDAAGFAFGIPVMNPLTEFGIAEMAGLKKGRKKK